MINCAATPFNSAPKIKNIKKYVVKGIISAYKRYNCVDKNRQKKGFQKLVSSIKQRGWRLFPSAPHPVWPPPSPP